MLVAEDMENTVYDRSVSLHCYDIYCFCESLYLYYCTDREATVRIKRSLKIWRILPMIALFLSIGKIVIAFVKAYTCIIVQIEKRLYGSRDY